MGKSVIPLFPAFLLLLFLLPPFPPTARAAEIPLFVSVLPQRYLAARIGGSRVDLSVMVGPGRSPATYEPSPRQMSLLSKARIYFAIGIPFEQSWMKRIQAANPSMTVVDTVAGIALRTGTGDGHGREDIDPHIWTSPPLAKRLAAAMKDALVAADPSHEAEYEENFRLLAADLDDLDRRLRLLLQGVSSRKFMVFHPSWGYFADTYGLEQIAIEEGGREPGARRLAALIDRARREDLRAIFVQEQFSRRSAERIALETGARVIVVDPLAEDYLANLERVARLLAEAMR